MSKENQSAVSNSPPKKKTNKSKRRLSDKDKVKLLLMDASTPMLTADSEAIALPVALLLPVLKLVNKNLTSIKGILRKAVNESAELPDQRKDLSTMPYYYANADGESKKRYFHRVRTDKPTTYDCILAPHARRILMYSWA